MRRAVKETSTNLRSMQHDQFMALLEAHANGDIAQILQKTNYFETSRHVAEREFADSLVTRAAPPTHSFRVSGTGALVESMPNSLRVESTGTDDSRLVSAWAGAKGWSPSSPEPLCAA